MSFDKQLKQSFKWRGLYFVTLLLTNIVLARFLEASNNGLVFFLANFFSLIVLTASFNLEGSFTFFSSNQQVSHHRLAWFGLLWTSVIGCIIYFSLSFYFTHYGTDRPAITQWYAELGCYYSIGIILLNLFTALFYSLENFALPNKLLAVSNILFTALVLFAIKQETPAYIVINDYFFLILLQGLMLAIAFIYQYKSYLHIGLPDLAGLKIIFRFAAIALLANFVFFFVYRIDYWFVKYNCSAADLGNYIQASKMAQMLLILPQIIASAVFPQTAKDKFGADVVVIIQRLCRLFLAGYLILFILCWIIGQWLFTTVFGSSFSNMHTPFLILLPGIFGLSVSSLCSAYFAGKNRNKINIYAAVLALIIVVIGNLLFWHQYTIIIAAIVSTVAYLVESFYCLRIFLKEEKLSWRAIFIVNKEDWHWLKGLLKKG